MRILCPLLLAAILNVEHCPGKFDMDQVTQVVTLQRDADDHAEYAVAWVVDGVSPGWMPLLPGDNPLRSTVSHQRQHMTQVYLQKRDRPRDPWYDVAFSFETDVCRQGS